MNKFIYLYRGPATPMEDMSEEQNAEQFEAWNKWQAQVGSALQDFGTPFGERATVSDDGTSGTPSDLNGYSIVEADNLAEAKALLGGHPFLAEGKGRFTVEVFELVPLPGM
jgi:hypothetical protein